MQHVRDCLTHLDAVRYLSERPAELELAIWFHDAIYDTHCSDNEERSAQWAHQHAFEQGLSADVAARVRDLILATKHDTLFSDSEAALLMDIDLASLGYPVDEFDRQEPRIRQEYDWVPETAFREGRAKILQRFLERDLIYQTEYFCERYERQARLNLQRSLASLNAKLNKPET
jgi:predicted metal-dependent HD superfamily phosphohydrolase